MKNRQVSNIFFVLLLTSACCSLLFTGCVSYKKRLAQYYTEIGRPIKPRPAASSAYQRDSVLLLYTALQWQKSGQYPYQYFVQHGKQQEGVKFSIDSILYSPDSLKLIAFVIKQFPGEDGCGAGYTVENRYSGTAFAAFRETKKQLWSVHPFTQYQPVCFNKYEEVHHLLRRYYLRNGKFKTASEYVRGPNGEWISATFDFNLDELEFWTNSVVWRKGARIPGYYNFQLKGNYGPDDLDKAFWPSWEFEYSEEIKQLYR